MYVGEGLAIGEIVLRLPTQATIHLAGDIALIRVGHSTEVVLIAIAIIAPEGKIDTKAGAELQTWQDIKLSIE